MGWDRDERGATAVEYGLIVGFIALGVMGSLVMTKASLNAVYGTIASDLGGDSSAPAGPAVTPLKAVASSSRSSYWTGKTLAATPTTTTSGSTTTKTFTFTDGTKAVLRSGSGGNFDTSLVVTDPNSMTRNTVYTDPQGRPFQFVQYQFYDTAMGNVSRSDILDNPGSSMGAPPVAYQDQWATFDTAGNNTGRSTYYQSNIAPAATNLMATQFQDLKYFQGQ